MRATPAAPPPPLWHVTNPECCPLACKKKEHDVCWELALSSSFIRCATAFIICGNDGGWGGVEEVGWGRGPAEGGGLDNDIGGSAERGFRELSGVITSH